MSFLSYFIKFNKYGSLICNWHFDSHVMLLNSNKRNYLCFVIAERSHPLPPPQKKKKKKKLVLNKAMLPFLC